MKTCTDKECELIEEKVKTLALKYLRKEVDYHTFTNEMNVARNEYYFKNEYKGNN